MSWGRVGTGVGVVVLAAGAGTRFGGGKLLALLEGRPVIQHVLEAVRAIAPASCIVVLGADAAVIEAAVDWQDEVRVINPTPGTGLSGSLRLGVATCVDTLPDGIGVLVVLADQPRTSPEVMRALIGSIPDARAAGAWAVAPRYALGGGANPALLLEAALARVPELEGDSGMNAMLTAQPGRLHLVDVPGANPDVDTRADLAALAQDPR
jgi:molybdenum cofactor cytidylyltransferase